MKPCQYEEALPRKSLRERAFQYWGGRARTFNLLVNSQALCQLSYTPMRPLDWEPPWVGGPWLGHRRVRFRELADERDRQKIRM